MVTRLAEADECSILIHGCAGPARVCLIVLWLINMTEQMRIFKVGVGLWLLVSVCWVYPALSQPRNYIEQIPQFWSLLYPSGGTSFYCGENFARFDRRYNIEHVFPMSWVTRALGCGTRKECRINSARFNLIEMDMHNLFPAHRDINKARSYYAFAEIPGEDWYARGCDIEIDERARRVEPRPAVRGDVARAMLYMSERYGLPLYSRQKQLMLKWHAADPPDAGERRRNQLIEAYQGNRNAWID